MRKADFKEDPAKNKLNLKTWSASGGQTFNSITTCFVSCNASKAQKNDRKDYQDFNIGRLPITKIIVKLHFLRQACCCSCFCANLNLGKNLFVV